jgi:hypothetical protein
MKFVVATHRLLAGSRRLKLNRWLIDTTQTVFVRGHETACRDADHRHVAVS